MRPMFSVSVLIGAAWLWWLTWRRGVELSGLLLNAGALDGVLWAFLAWAMVSAGLAGWTDPGITRLAVLGAYLTAFYVVRIRYTPGQVAGGAVLAGWVLLGIGAIEAVYRVSHGLGDGLWLFCNPNLYAALLVLIVPIGAATLAGRERWAWLVLGISVMAATQSRGGMIALAVALLVLAWPGLRPALRWASVGAGAALAPASLLIRPSTVELRLEGFATAWAAFCARPVAGWGPGSYAGMVHPGDWFYSHNMLLTVGAEMGLLGLAALGLVVWQAWRIRHNGPWWAWAALVGFAVHSMVDEPLWFWGPGLGVMALLALLSTKKGETAMSMFKKCPVCGKDTVAYHCDTCDAGDCDGRGAEGGCWHCSDPECSCT
ncbi:MAG: hypothetical protein KKB13_05605 [Chloroflexi bacterium]|nr:hypothetical protein [Chloroflexota bacterium]